MSIYARITLIASGLYLTACASTPEKLQGADYYYVEGQKAYDKKRCVEASEHFQRLVSNFPRFAARYRIAVYARRVIFLQ